MIKVSLCQRGRGSSLISDNKKPNDDRGVQECDATAD